MIQGNFVVVTTIYNKAILLAYYSKIVIVYHLHTSFDLLCKNYDGIIKALFRKFESIFFNVWVCKTFDLNYTCSKLSATNLIPSNLEVRTNFRDEKSIILFEPYFH